MRGLRFVLIVVVGSSVSFLNAQQCGGKERWAPKEGTDSLAAQIDLGNVTPISVHDLVNIPQPSLPPPADNNSRLQEETHLYRVDARLVKWKHETGSTGDSDYHLVLTDETLSFTDEHAGVPPTFHSFIGEIPDPDCLAGSTGHFGTTSPFLDHNPTLNIRSARSELEAKFPQADQHGGWNQAGGLPVEIVGIGFFDRAHQQAGRAPNNIEIHPILAINFNAGGTPPIQPVTPAPGPQPPPAGPQWEYQMITSNNAAELTSQANTLGAQGWEMVSVVVDTTRPDKYVGYLKKRK
jgi:hypothetical protein